MDFEEEIQIKSEQRKTPPAGRGWWRIRGFENYPEQIARTRTAEGRCCCCCALVGAKAMVTLWRPDAGLSIGSGYFAALLAHCAGRVFSVEINARLAKLGEANLAAQGIDNVTVENGDAARGWSRHAPFQGH